MDDSVLPRSNHGCGMPLHKGVCYDMEVLQNFIAAPLPDDTDGILNNIYE